MSSKTIKLKLTLTKIKDGYNADELLNQIKNCSLVLSNDSNGYCLTASYKHEWDAATDYAERINQLTQLRLFQHYKSVDDNIAILKISFLNTDDSEYQIPDSASIDGSEIIIDFLYTLEFTNETYPSIDVDLPDEIKANAGDQITLPTIDGEYEDNDNIYTPVSWNIGEFGESITLNENMTANLICTITPKYIDVKLQMYNNNTCSQLSSNGKYGSFILAAELQKIKNFGLPVITYHPTLNPSNGIIGYSSEYTYTLTGFVTERDTTGNNNWVEYNKSLESSPFNMFTCGYIESIINYNDYSYFGLIYSGSFYTFGSRERIKYWKCRIRKN